MSHFLSKASAKTNSNLRTYNITKQLIKLLTINSSLILIINLFSKTYTYKSQYNVVWSLEKTVKGNMRKFIKIYKIDGKKSKNKENLTLFNVFCSFDFGYPVQCKFTNFFFSSAVKLTCFKNTLTCRDLWLS